MQTPDSVSWFSFFSFEIYHFDDLNFRFPSCTCKYRNLFNFFFSFDNHSVTDALFCSFLEIYHSETWIRFPAHANIVTFFFFLIIIGWGRGRLEWFCDWMKFAIGQDPWRRMKHKSFFFGCVNMISSHLDHFISILSPICNFSFFKNF